MTTRPRKKRKLAKVPRTISERKAPKTYRLAARQIAEARKILGAPSDTAAIEMALDMITFRAELVAGVRAMSGARLQPFDKD
jgi:hypothetical protein